MQAKNETKPDQPAGGFESSYKIRNLLDLRHRFVTYNITRIRELLRYLSPRKTQLFRMIPFLLHVNSPEYPGFVSGAGDAFGIYRFHASGFWKLAQKDLKFTPRDLKPFLSKTQHIRGLYLMGSSGTLAQMKSSDFDYWVLVDESISTPRHIQALRRKLDKIETWGAETYQQQITFFILTLSQIKDNNFAAIDAESSGSAQRTLLKEEFYRTFIMIAGQVPFWAIFPPGLSRVQYKDFVHFVSNVEHVQFYPEDYIDLGYLDAIDTRECLGAILWQVYKARKDPVKALLKASLVTYYLFFNETRNLLCDVIKRRFLESGPGAGDGLNDPYAVVFSKAMAFYEEIQDPQGLEMIKECVYLRITGFHQAVKPNPDSPKMLLLNAYLTQWDWSGERIRRFAAYASWPESEKLEFEARISAKLSFLYEMVVRGGENAEAGIDMRPEDLESLKNRIACHFKTWPGKLPRASTYLKAKAPHFSLSIRYDENPVSASTVLPLWSVADLTQPAAAGGDTPIFTGPELLRIFGWIIANHLIPEDADALRFQINRFPVPAIKIRRLFYDVLDFLTHAPPQDEAFSREPSPNRILVLLDMQPSGAGGARMSAEALLQNTWGEIGFKDLEVSQLENHDLKCYKIAQVIRDYLSGNACEDWRIIQLRDVPEPGTIHHIEKLIEDGNWEVPGADAGLGAPPATNAMASPEMALALDDEPRPMLDLDPIPLMGDRGASAQDASDLDEDGDDDPRPILDLY